MIFIKKIFFILTVIFTCTLCVYAHPGRTDSKGGHKDSSTGTYHYHHGYPAHQHTNGQCPYNFDDKTGQSSGSSSSGNSNNNSSYKSNNYDKDGDGTFLVVIIIGAILVWLYREYDYFLYSKQVEAYKKEQEEYERSRQIQIEKDRQLKFEEEKQKFLAMYGNLSARDIANVPKSIVFDNQDLPHKYRYSKNMKILGDNYKVKISKSNGTAYHKSTCQYGKVYINYVEAVYKGYSPCKRCHPITEDVSWYAKYKEIKQLKQKYNIPD